ncbi:acetolactate synthase large subunit [Vannielia litorea]|uniref:acetolactate synthase large subunit n=1 Tax=Vannielia litorea TaxID=1217970 RepID=UPI001BCEA186|nr:acetolactate synthase large subunit [Vannielia litorea]MBS8225943.1 acetolactate synthase large subunit [Vannielia litorea]
MNGAEALTRALLAGGVDTCFANPGTSEMHFVAALDRFEDMRPVLCLFEGVATGAADGFGRMVDRPAATLMHLGFGLSGGLANLHNARKAPSPVVNVVGDHASWHRASGSALVSDVEALAKPMSDWVKTSGSAADVSSDAAEAIAAARSRGGQVATLVLPADTAWSEGGIEAAPPAPAPESAVDEGAISAAAKALTSGEPAMLLLGGAALRAVSLACAGRIAAATSARLATPYGIGRLERGVGRVRVERLPALIDPARKVFAGIRHVILAGTGKPAAMFAYPDKPRAMEDPGTIFHTLCGDPALAPAALAALCEALGAKVDGPVEQAQDPAIPEGALTPDAILRCVAAAMPPQAIIVDESISAGRNFFPLSQGAVPHDYLQLPAGALGNGIPVALGAALACPDRPVINLEGDGSAMYTVQGLWTQAREQANVTTIIFSNRRYNILDAELKNVGVAGEMGSRARGMLSLDRPDIGWIDIARGFGVDAVRVEDAARLATLIASAATRQGPLLIEAVLP